MADGGEKMGDALPSKRAKFDFFLDIEDESTRSDDNNVSAISESLTANGGESTLTSDSGFNEYTPPQSIEDDNINAGCASHSYSFERSEFEVGMPRGGPSGLGLDPNSNEEDVDDTCSVGSTASNLSGLSNLSTISGKDWKPCAGPMSWVQQQMEKGVNPRSVLTQILGGSWQIPEGISDFMLWHIIINMLSEPPKRERLRHINTLEDVLRLIKVCKKIIVLTGAGVSVSCGIPDFRSKDGIYVRLAADFPDLPDPQAMFDIHYFRKDPRPFFKFAREIYPGQFTPSLCHRFIRMLEQNNKLLRNYTQNIDTLEQVANIKRVIQCHGSFATATCQRCCHKVDADVIKEDIFVQRIPMCTLCTQIPSPEKSDFYGNCGVCLNGVTVHDIPFTCQNKDIHRSQHSAPVSSRESFGGLGDSENSHLLKSPGLTPESVMKPDIVFFGEGLPDEFHDRMAEDKDECDLLIVIGSSLKVRPVALIPSSIPPSVPQILINREPLSHLTFDVELLGDCDVIVSELCRRLGDSWRELSIGEPLSEIQALPPRAETTENSSSDSSLSQPTPAEAPHPKDESDIEALRACWAPKVKESMSARLPEGKYLFAGGHRYVFPGAEVYYDPDDEEDSDSKSSGSETEDDLDNDLENDLETDRLPAVSQEEKGSGLIGDPNHSSGTFAPPRLSSSWSSDSVDGSSSDSGAIGAFRRSSQALSEDVDSLLSGASSCCGDPTNGNTPDHPSSEGGPWGCRTTDSSLINSHAEVAARGSTEDWTNLSASLDSTTTSTISSSKVTHVQQMESHFVTLSSRLSEKAVPLDRSERGHTAQCSV